MTIKNTPKIQRQNTVRTLMLAALGAVSASGSACGRIDQPAPVVTPVGSERPASSGGNTTTVLTTTVTPINTNGVNTLPTTTTTVRTPQRDTALLANGDADFVAMDEALPAIPPEPTYDPQMRARVLQMRGVMAMTANCWESSPASRMPHVADRRCPQWFEQLNNGGVAAVHAIGERISDPTSSGAMTSQLTSLLENSRELVAAQYLARRFHRIASMEPTQAQILVMTEAYMIAGFEFVTGFPVNDHPAWVMASPMQLATKLRPAFIRALRWWHRNHDLPEEARRQEGEARLRAWLTAEPAKAVHAALVIAGRPESQLLRTPARDAMELIVNNGRSTANERNAARSALIALQTPVGQRQPSPRIGGPLQLN